MLPHPTEYFPTFPSDDRCTAKDLEGRGCALIKILSYSPGGTDEDHSNFQSGQPEFK
jgi:hypothetical protein